MYAVYQLNARKLERKLQRCLNKRGYFTTANGYLNYVLQYCKKSVVIRTSFGDKPLTINRTNLRKALSFLYFTRTAVIKDMEKFSNFSSALFGLVMECFKDLSKLEVLQRGQFRLSLKGVRFYASGLERSPATLRLYKKLGGKFTLMNYIQCLQSPKWLRYLDEFDLYTIIDSGSFSVFNQKQKHQKHTVQQQELFNEKQSNDMTIEGYAKFINLYKDHPRILGFLPFDVVGDATKTRENYQKLKELTNGKIYPVWQITDSIAELEKLVEEEHEMYCIGGMVPFLSNRQSFLESRLDEVVRRFPTINMHLLGVANELLLEYRAFSSDSTAYINARKSQNQRKLYLSNGLRIDAPESMSTDEIISQNLEFLISLETLKEHDQLTIESYFLKGAS
jgi:hypothetical protein